MTDYKTYRLSEIAYSTKGKKPKTVSKEKSDGFEIPYVDIKAFEKGIIDNYTDGENCTFCTPDDVLIVWDGARCGFVGRGVEGAIGSTLAKISSEKYINDYLFYFLQSKYKVLNSNPRGVGIPHIEPNLLWNFEIPDIDKTTQHQIVSRIESLFAELDKAVEHLRTAQQQLKTYRQAVLNHWLNNEDGKWETVKLGEVAEKIQIGPFGTQLHKSDYIDGGTPLINPMHIYNKKILPDYSFSVSDEKYKELTNYYLEKDDVILGRRGEMGRCAVVSEKEDGMLCGTGSLFIRGGKLLDATYLCHLLSSQKLVSYFENSSSGTTMSNLNQGIIKNCEIPFPPLSEQQRIVEEIETRLSQAEAAEARIAEALQKTEALRQSILKKAFSGEFDL